MAGSFTPEVERLLLDHDTAPLNGKVKATTKSGFSPITNRRFVVDQHMKSRHTANGVLKQAGIGRRL